MKKFDSSVIMLVVANCVPLAGVLFFGWSLFSLLIGFWLETGIIGIFVLLKSIYLYKLTSKTAFLINSFVVMSACAGFMFGHFIVIMALFSVVPGGDGWTGLNLFSQSYMQLITMAITLFISHGYSFFFNFISRDERSSLVRLVDSEGADSRKVGNLLVGDVFKRIVLLQFILIFGGVVMALTRTTIYLSVIFIITKMVVDLILHIKRHRISS